MIEVNGSKYSSTFIILTEGGLYTSSLGYQWKVHFTRLSTPSYGNHPIYALEDVGRDCPTARNELICNRFRAALRQYTGLRDGQLDAYMQKQVEGKKQILIHRGRVAKHISTTPVEEVPLSVVNTAEFKYGCPAELVVAFRDWRREHTKELHGVKMKAAVRMFLTSALIAPESEREESPVIEESHELVPAPIPELVEEREHREDVPFYGRRRRDQASFRADVALNCGDRCVFTNASAIRCEAAHLVAHARQGGASFKNGLLLRADLHAMLDAGKCAIDPVTLQIWFAAELLETDADLQRINGAKMRPTMKPINVANLVERWAAFNGE